MAEKEDHKHEWVKVRIAEYFAYGMMNRLSITWACGCGADKQTGHLVVRTEQAQNV